MYVICMSAFFRARLCECGSRWGCKHCDVSVCLPRMQELRMHACLLKSLGEELLSHQAVHRKTQASIPPKLQEPSKNVSGTDHSLASSYSLRSAAVTHIVTSNCGFVYMIIRIHINRRSKLGTQRNSLMLFLHKCLL